MAGSRQPISHSEDHFRHSGFVEYHSNDDVRPYLLIGVLDFVALAARVAVSGLGGVCKSLPVKAFQPVIVRKMLVAYC